jgi:hypothetical protein
MSKNRIKALEAYDWRGDEKIAALPAPAQFLLFRLAIAADTRGAVILPAEELRPFGMNFEQLARALKTLSQAGYIEPQNNGGVILPAVRKHLAICWTRAKNGRRGAARTNRKKNGSLGRGRREFSQTLYTRGN